MFASLTQSTRGKRFFSLCSTFSALMPKGKCDFVGDTFDVSLEKTVHPLHVTPLASSQKTVHHLHSHCEGSSAKRGSRLAYVNVVFCQYFTWIKAWQSGLWMKCLSFPQNFSIEAYIQVHMLTIWR